MDKKYDIKIEMYKHMKNVSDNILKFIYELEMRAINHDRSKLLPPERAVFEEYIPLLKATTYGSENYNEVLGKMNQAIRHHYHKNRHHPEHFEKGVDDMNLIDIIEMLADWKAVTLWHDDGDIKKSIEINSKRFKISLQLKRILLNTLEIMEE